MKGLSGKRFIIGGGATGMGACLAQRLIDEGARVMVGDINHAGLETLAASSGGAIETRPFDLSDSTSIAALVDHAVAAFGGVDGVAISGADLSKETLGRDAAITAMNIDVWERTLRVNLIGHALTMQAAIPHLVNAGGGAIVSISSAAAYEGSPTMPAYASSKAGMQALIRHVARIAGPSNVRCNGVAPGFVLTEGASVNMTPELLENVKSSIALPRLGEPEDIASMIAFLLSDEGSWITGQTIAINGGASFRD